MTSIKVKIALLSFIVLALATQLAYSNNDTGKRSAGTSVDSNNVSIDNDHMQTIQKIQNSQDEFKQQVEHYLEEIDHQLTEEQMTHLIKEANLHKVPKGMLLKLLDVESNFEEDLVGPPTKYGHAYGMSQFMTNTAPWVADMAGMDYEFDDLFDPKYSITLAVTYLHYLQYGDNHSHDGYNNWHTTLTAYHRGMGGMRAYKRNNNTTVTNYSKSIVRHEEITSY